MCLYQKTSTIFRPKKQNHFVKLNNFMIWKKQHSPSRHLFSRNLLHPACKKDSARFYWHTPLSNYQKKNVLTKKNSAHLYIWIVFTLFGPYFHNFYQYYQQYFDQTIGYLTRYYYSCSEFFFPSINNLHKTSGSGLKIISVFLPSNIQVFFCVLSSNFIQPAGNFFQK